MDNPLVQPEPGLYIWTIVTFLILAGLLRKFAWGPLLTALEVRQETIKKSLDEARLARQEAERLRAESAQLLDTARVEGAAMLARMREDANRAGEELRQKARADAEKIVRNAERQIEGEVARAAQRVRQDAVDLSIAIASKIIQRNLSKEDNERLITETLQAIAPTTRPN